jgi:membrane associated rhomboid family serine protease
MLFLFVFGNTLEKMIGRDYHLAVFFIGGFTAFLVPPALGLYTPDTGMLGASAAIFTLAACVMLMGLVAMFYFLYNVALVYDPTLIPGLGYDPNIAYIAHVIGFTVGIPFGISWSKRWPRNLLITLGLFGIYLAILAILATFFGLRLPLGLL